MYTFNLPLVRFTDEARAAALEICRRMGWNFDEEGGEVVVNVPCEDGALFDFVFSDVL